MNHPEANYSKNGADKRWVVSVSGGILINVVCALLIFPNMSWAASTVRQPPKTSTQHVDRPVKQEPAKQEGLHSTQPPEGNSQSEGNPSPSISEGPKKRHDERHSPVREYQLPNGQIIRGQEVSIGKKKMVIQVRNSDESIEKAVDFLTQNIRSTLTAISLLHPAADAAVLKDVKDKWGGRNFVEYPTKENIDKIFSENTGTRFVVFGHIVETLDGGSFVTLDINEKPQQEISISWLQQQARQRKVELIIVGCKSFMVGASAGVLHIIPANDLPELLHNIKESHTRAELYASFSDHDNPVFIDPVKLVEELSSERLEIRRVYDKKPIARLILKSQPSPQVQQPPYPVQELKEPPPPVQAEADIPFELTASVFFKALLGLLLTYITLQTALLNPIHQIVKYHNYRYGRFGRLRKFLGKVARDVDEKSEVADPGKPTAKGGIGCILLLIAPFAFRFGFELIGIVLIFPIILIFVGMHYQDLNKEYEK